MSRKHKRKFSKEKQGVENALPLPSGFGVRETRYIRNHTRMGKKAVSLEHIPASISKSCGSVFYFLLCSNQHSTKSPRSCGVYFLLNLCGVHPLLPLPTCPILIQVPGLSSLFYCYGFKGKVKNLPYYILFCAKPSWEQKTEQTRDKEAHSQFHRDGVPTTR